MPPSPEYPEGLIVSGGREAIIDVRQPSRLAHDNADGLLLGHSANVCALHVSEDGRMIVSGGWDAEARVWQVGKWEAQAVLGDHKGSVWAVLAYDRETVITGKAFFSPFLYTSIFSRSSLPLCGAQNLTTSLNYHSPIISGALPKGSFLTTVIRTP